MAVELTYCTNVHPVNSLQEWKDTVSFFGPAIQKSLNVNRLSLGLWFNATICREILSHSSQLQAIRDQLEEHNLWTFTLNGFPYGNFHVGSVKKSVYSPDWRETDRLNYSLHCAEILAALLPGNRNSGSVSTLPLGWRENWTASKSEAAAEKLLQACQGLQKLRDKSGKSIRLSLEPEPGCALEKIIEVIVFWNEVLRPKSKKMGMSEEILCEFLGICYDTCHQAVEFEDPIECLQLLAQNNIPIGKMQLSNALEFPPDRDKITREARLSFAEKKFLHQTIIQSSAGEYRFYSDLPKALDDETTDWNCIWRSHFHVPLHADNHLSQKGLRTTGGDMKKALLEALRLGLCSDFEVETYTWNILPSFLAPTNKEELAEGISRELKFTYSILQEAGYG